MASFDLASITAFEFGAQGLITANTDSVAIDTQGYEGVTIVASSGTGTLSTTNKFTIQFVESDDTNISNATAVQRAETGSIIATNSVVSVGAVPEKRYLFAKLIKGASASANIAVIGALGYPVSAPTP